MRYFILVYLFFPPTPCARGEVVGFGGGVEGLTQLTLISACLFLLPKPHSRKVFLYAPFNCQCKKAIYVEGNKTGILQLVWLKWLL